VRRYDTTLRGGSTKSRYIIIRHVLSKSLYIHTYIHTYIRRYRNNGNGLSDREYIFGRPRRRKTLSFPAFDLTSSFHDFVDPRNCVDPRSRVVSYLLTLILHSSSQNRSVSRIPFGCHARCGGMLMMGCLPSSSTVSPHCDRVNSEMHSEAVIERVWRCTWRP